mmetsp:Transcript_1767/g.2438  ORF Transcript_1767/g.2438 Transcript_1767/m.2438 type:complete len:104 (-) Transcript_1767:35-346(-)
MGLESNGGQGNGTFARRTRRSLCGRLASRHVLLERRGGGKHVLAEHGGGKRASSETNETTAVVVVALPTQFTVPAGERATPLLPWRVTVVVVASYVVPYVISS